jgi:hypothetical protein
MTLSSRMPGLPDPLRQPRRCSAMTARQRPRKQRRSCEDAISSSQQAACADRSVSPIDLQVGDRVGGGRGEGRAVGSRVGGGRGVSEAARVGGAVVRRAEGRTDGVGTSPSQTPGGRRWRPSCARREGSARRLHDALLATATSQLGRQNDPRDLMVGLAVHYVVAQKIRCSPDDRDGMTATADVHRRVTRDSRPPVDARP